MGHRFKQRGITNYCNAFNTKTYIVNHSVGELMEKFKDDKQMLQRIRSSENFKLVTTPIKQRMTQYLNKK